MNIFAKKAFRTHVIAGRELFRSKHFSEALKEYKLARDSWLNFRAHSALNERLRELSRGKPQVHLVDFEQELNRVGLEIGIGCNFFGDSTYCDQLHLNTRSHAIMANMIREVIKGLEKLDPSYSADS